VRMVQPTFAFANGNVTADVEFPANTEVPPPNPQFLNVHAAFAKVLACSEVAEYVERIEMRNESGAPTDPSCWLPHLSIFPDCLSEVFTSCSISTPCIQHKIHKVPLLLPESASGLGGK